MGPDLDTDQGDGNLESPFPPLQHNPTLALYTTLELQNTARGCITPLTQSPAHYPYFWFWVHQTAGEGC